MVSTCSSNSAKASFVTNGHQTKPIYTSCNAGNSFSASPNIFNPWSETPHAMQSIEKVFNDLLSFKCLIIFAKTLSQTSFQLMFMSRFCNRGKPESPRLNSENESLVRLEQPEKSIIAHLSMFIFRKFRQKPSKASPESIVKRSDENFSCKSFSLLNPSLIEYKPWSSIITQSLKSTLSLFKETSPLIPWLRLLKPLFVISVQLYERISDWITVRLDTLWSREIDFQGRWVFGSFFSDNLDQYLWVVHIERNQGREYVRMGDCGDNGWESKEFDC